MELISFIQQLLPVTSHPPLFNPFLRTFGRYPSSLVACSASSFCLSSSMICCLNFSRSSWWERSSTSRSWIKKEWNQNPLKKWRANRMYPKMSELKFLMASYFSGVFFRSLYLSYTVLFFPPSVYPRHVCALAVSSVSSVRSSAQYDRPQQIWPASTGYDRESSKRMSKKVNIYKVLRCQYKFLKQKMNKTFQNKINAD